VVSAIDSYSHILGFIKGKSVTNFCRPLKVDGAIKLNVSECAIFPVSSDDI
jgi:hypothetical protein